MRMLLAIAGLTCVWSLCGPIRAQPKEAAPPRERWQKPIVGRGETEVTAKKDAWREAAEIIDFLRQQQKPLVKLSDFTELEVRRRFLANAGSAGDDIHIEEFDRPFKQWIVHLKPETERLLRADERQTMSSIGMIGLSILLVAGFAYLRLDEYTHRRYTTWLRLAGVGVATSALAGCWAVVR